MKRTHRMVVMLFALQLWGQTRIDLQQQSRGSAFLQPPFSQPLRVGTALPPVCNPGELYFVTTASPGANVQVCHSPNQWAPQGSAGLGNVSVMTGSSLIGTRSTIGFSAGNGVTVLGADTGSGINVQFELDTAHFPTFATLRNGESTMCQSVQAVTGVHECGLVPALNSYQPGMVLQWKPDADSDGNPLSLDVDYLGAKAVKLPDGIAYPAAGDLRAGQVYTLWYDGTQFRILSFVSPRDFANPRQLQSGSLLYCESSSTVASQYACSVSPALEEYEEGMLLFWRPDIAPDTGAPTLRIDGLTAKSLAGPDGSTALSVTEVTGGELYLIWYDGTGFRVLNPRRPEYVTPEGLQRNDALKCESHDTLNMQFQCLPSPQPASIARGSVFYWIPDQSPEGPALLTVGSHGPFPIKRADGATDPMAGDAPVGALVPVWFDGSQFRITGALGGPAEGTVRPPCDVSMRGKSWYVPGGAGQKDEYAICVKDEEDVYAWHIMY